MQAQTRRIEASGNTMARGRMVLFLIFLLAHLGVRAEAQGPQNHWVEPFHMIGNIYYVGLSNNTSFLITTPEGHILLDPTTEAAVPDIRKSIEQLGFQLKDIKIILNAHAHSDHVGGLKEFKELTGAKVLVMAEDAEAVADGGRSDFRGDGKEQWQPVRADQIIHDKEQIHLGGITLVAHLTPGHTKGCTTWTMVTEEKGRKYNVAFICSMGLGPGVPLIANTKYPTIAEDYSKSFEILRSLPCDVFLVSHSAMFNREEKAKRLKQGTDPNPFIDPEGYQAFMKTYESYFLEELRKQQSGAPPSTTVPGRSGS